MANSPPPDTHIHDHPSWAASPVQKNLTRQCYRFTRQEQKGLNCGCHGERGGHFFEDKKIFLIARYEVLKNSQYCQMQFDGFEIPGSSRQHSGESWGFWVSLKSEVDGTIPKSWLKVLYIAVTQLSGIRTICLWVKLLWQNGAGCCCTIAQLGRQCFFCSYKLCVCLAN